MLPKVIITDIDGVWTDGGMYYDQLGNELKKFNTSDSAGVLFCKLLGIPVVIMTGEKTSIVERRASKLKIDLVFQGVFNKLECGKTLIKELGLQWKDTAFIGDDINDLPLLDVVGISGSPRNAPNYVQERTDIVTKATGGQGAFREFVETILNRNNLMDEALDRHYEYILKGNETR